MTNLSQELPLAPSVGFSPEIYPMQSVDAWNFLKGYYELYTYLINDNGDYFVNDNNELIIF